MSWSLITVGLLPVRRGAWIRTLSVGDSAGRASIPPDPLPPLVTEHRADYC